MYETGSGVRKDKGKAKKYFGKACDGGEERGCSHYAQLHKESDLEALLSAYE
jgi:TPR repeat protein